MLIASANKYSGGFYSTEKSARIRPVAPESTWCACLGVTRRAWTGLGTHPPPYAGRIHAKGGNSPSVFSPPCKEGFDFHKMSILMSIRALHGRKETFGAHVVPKSVFYENMLDYPFGTGILGVDWGVIGFRPGNIIAIDINTIFMRIRHNMMTLARATWSRLQS